MAQPGITEVEMNLPITAADGSTVNAIDLRLVPLQVAMQRAGVAGMKGEMGKEALLDIYRQHLGASPFGGKQ